MKVCDNFKRGITCENVSDIDDGCIYCKLSYCKYREIDYKQLMEDEHTYKRENRRIKQVR